MLAAQTDTVRSARAGGERVRPPGSAVRRFVRLPTGHPRRVELRAELITAYLPVAHNIAHRFVHRGDHPDDLEQVATLGLIGAVDRVEPERGVDFLSFAVPTITGEIRRHFRDRSRTIRIPAPDHPAAGRPHEAANSSPSASAAHRGPASSPSNSASPAGGDRDPGRST